MTDLLDANDSGPLTAEADLGDVDLHAEHLLSHIGLAALTGGIDAPARALAGIMSDPLPQGGEGGSGRETPPAPEEMQSSDFSDISRGLGQEVVDVGIFARGVAPGGPDPGLLAHPDLSRGLGQGVVDPGIFARPVAPYDQGSALLAASSDVPPSPQQGVPAPGIPPAGRAAPGGRGSAPQAGSQAPQSASPPPPPGGTDPARPQDPVEALRDKYLESLPQPTERDRGRIQNLVERLHGKPDPGDTGIDLNPDKTTRHMGIENQGGTRAWRNNSPGNLEEPESKKMNDWHNRFGAEKADDGFLKFPSAEQGLAALQDLLSDDGPYNGFNVRDGIKKFAGLNDPDPDDPNYEAIHKANAKHLDDYLNTLTGFGVNVDGPMLEQRDRVIPGIIQHEGYYAGIQHFLGT